jgi:hypothetical protein
MLRFRLGMWLKWYSACLANLRPQVQTPVLPKKKKKKKTRLKAWLKW